MLVIVNILDLNIFPYFSYIWLLKSKYTIERLHFQNYLNHQSPPFWCQGNILKNPLFHLFYQLQLSFALFFSCPSNKCLHSILDQTNRVTFYGFLMALAKSETINSDIGTLPSKGELFGLGGSDSEFSR